MSRVVVSSAGGLEGCSRLGEFGVVAVAPMGFDFGAMIVRSECRRTWAGKPETQ